MPALLVTFLAVAVAVFVASKIVTGVKVKRDGALVAIAIVFGLLNVLVGWLIKVVMAIALIPVAIVTLGVVYLFLGVLVNMVLLWITDKLVGDFEIKTFRALFSTAFLISLVGWLLRIAMEH